MSHGIPLRFAPGLLLDGFTLGARIHTGAMASLWEVTHPDHEGPLLMKVPDLSEGSDPASLVGFEMEQMILPRLTGPHVPRCLARGGFAARPDLVPYLVMERLPGPSLLSCLERLPLPIEEVASYGARIALALADLHPQGVIHLDVKPSNLMQRPSGEIVLIDFGLAHHADLPDLLAEEFRLPYGTAPYMAPEQVLGERGEARSDLFALGSLLYFFTTGVRPFGDPQRLSGLKRRLWRDPWPPRVLRPDCPPWLQEVILRCLEVPPAWRHPTAAQLAFDLLHPEQVKLTARAERLRRDPFTAVLRRRFREPSRPPQRRGPAAARSAAPILAVALDLTEEGMAMSGHLRETVAHLLRPRPEARLACLHVLRQGVLTLDETLDAHGANKHLQRLLELRHWAEPLGLEEGRVSFHVLESPHPAAALLSYLHANPVDHVVLGARAHSFRKALLGSVSNEVSAHAPCTVTIVRARPPETEGPPPPTDATWTVG